MGPTLKRVSSLNAFLAFIVSWTAVFYTIRGLSDFSKMSPAHTTDFLAQMTGASIVREGDIKNLYNYQVQFEYQQRLMGNKNIPNALTFRTPPTTAYILSLLPVENYVLAFWLAVGVNLLCVMVSIWLLTERSFNKTFVIGTIAAFLVPLLMTLIGGQPLGPILIFLTLAFINIKNNRPFMAGVWIALLFIKPNFLLATFLILPLLNDKKQLKKYLMGFAAALSLLIGLNMLLYGKGFLPDYIKFISSTEEEHSGTSIANNTNISGVIYTISSWLNKPYNNFIALAFTLITNVLTFLMIWNMRNKMSLEKRFALICLILPVLNLHTMYSDLLPHLISLTLLLPLFFDEKRWLAAIWLLLLTAELPYYSVANLEWVITLAIIVSTWWLTRTLISEDRNG
ncbi:MAG: hypothetical protein KatS3mg101_0055 [Patescibacteria group bacterium]|nr:MAG: hypothetical protein KatS3mg101_0055 [Patescibacteria group bacterium]